MRWRKEQEPVRWTVDIFPSAIIDEVDTEGNVEIRIGKDGWGWTVMSTPLKGWNTGEAESQEEAMTQALAALKSLRAEP